MAIAPDVVQANRRASKTGGTSSKTSATTPAVTTATATAKSKATKETKDPVTTTVPTTQGAPLDEFYFYPETFEGNTYCFRGAKTSITAQAKQQESLLYSSMCECCRKHKCVIDMSVECGTTAATTTAATTATAAVTTTPASYPMPTTPVGYYPLRGGDVVICVAATTATPYPANVDLFTDVCECCKKNGCTIPMDHCDETATTTTTPATPAVPIENYRYYPLRGGDVVTCVAATTATPYPANVDLFSDICECCKKNGCTIPMDQCDETTTTTTTPATRAVPMENHRYYPLMGGDVVICVAATTATPHPANVDLFSDICECCKKNGCTIPMDHCDETTTTTTATVTDATTTNAMITAATTTTARDAACQTEPFSVKVGTGCKEFFYCEGGRIIEKMSCPAGLFFNGGHCDLASNVDCEPDPDCREKPDSISAKVGTGCKDYVFCDNGLLLGTVTCPDGLLFNGVYCDLAEKVVCASNI